MLSATLSVLLISKMTTLIHKHLSKEKQIILINRLMGVAAVIHPLTAVPQVYKIYDTHNATGVSILTWLGFMTLGLIFLAYGIVHKIKPLIVTQVLWYIVDFLVVLGVLMYG